MLKYSKYIVSFLLAIGASSFFISGIMNNIWHSIILLLYLAATIFILFFDFSKLNPKLYENVKKIVFYLFGKNINQFTSLQITLFYLFFIYY